MRTVHKYNLVSVACCGSNWGDNKISLPKDADILTVGIQGTDVMLWAEVETTNAKEDRRFYVVGTGWAIDEKSKYIATFFDKGFVWHVYESSNEVTP